MKDFPRYALTCAFICGFAACFAWAGSASPQYPVAISVVFLIQWIGFAVAYARQTEAFFDLTGALTYFGITLALLAATEHPSIQAIILAATVSIWSVRLGIFLFSRIRASGGDDRFDEIKPNAGRFFTVWTIQALWITVTASAAWMALTAPKGLSWPATFFGTVVWMTGFAIETVADAQKSAFREVHPTGFITSGLWALSRHPNYFGEILAWLGVAIIAAPALSSASYLGLVSPIFVFLLLRYVSGVPLLEKKAESRWGDDPAYRAYRERTPLLLPFGGGR